MKSEFMIAITQLAAEKNLPKEVVLQAMESALASAYKKDSELQGNVVVRIDRETGDHQTFLERAVVQEVADPRIEIAITEARRIKPGATIGDVILTEVRPSHAAGRIAAQTAKQVVLQRLREAEREMVFEEFSNREGDIVSGVIQRLDAKQVIVDLGKTEAILPVTEQTPSEQYRPSQRMKFYLLEVHRSIKGPQLILSRTHKNLLKRLFELEVPEIYRGVVEIKSIAREAGYRSKVAVAARQEGVDAVGSCVGLRGIRIQNIVNELNGERIDVIQWDVDPVKFVAHALSPAQVLNVRIEAAENTASVIVPDRQLSLAIGKEGQNARLAAKLTSWRIDIKPESAVQETLIAAPVSTEPVRERAGMVREAPAPVDEQAVAAAPVEAPAEGAGQPEPDIPQVPAPAREAEPVGAKLRFAEDLAPVIQQPKKKAKKGERATDTEGKPKKAKRAPRRIDEDLDYDLEDLNE